MLAQTDLEPADVSPFGGGGPDPDGGRITNDAQEGSVVADRGLVLVVPPSGVGLDLAGHGPDSGGDEAQEAHPAAKGQGLQLGRG